MAPRRVRITRLGRAGIEYREGERALVVDSELIVDPNYDVVVYLGSIRGWRPPHDEEVLSAEDKARVIANLREKLRRERVLWED